MPFDTLSKKQQKFLKSYFKPKGFFSKKLKGDDREAVVGEFEEWQVVKQTTKDKIDELPDEVNKAQFHTKLDEATETFRNDGKVFKLVAAKQAAAKIVIDVTAAGRNYVDDKKTTARRYITEVTGYLGTALELPKLETSFNTLETSFAKSPPDFAAIKSTVSVVRAKRTELKTRSDNYKTNHDQVAGRLTNLENNVAAITDPIANKGKADITAIITKARQKLTEYSLKMADNLKNTGYWAFAKVEKLVARKTAYGLVKTDAETEIKKLTDKRNPGVEEACKVILADVMRAQIAEQNKDFYTATSIMEPMTQRVADLMPFADGYIEFQKELKTANDKIEELKTHPQAEFAGAALLEITTFRDRSETIAATGVFDDPIDRVKQIPKMCSDAAIEAAKAAPFGELGEIAKSGDLAEAITKAKALIEELKRHPRADKIDQAISDLTRDVATAETDVAKPDEAAARKKLTSVSELAVIAKKLADVIDQLHSRADALDLKADDLRSNHAQGAYVAAKITPIKEVIAEARKASLSGDDNAVKLIDKATADFGEAKKLAEAEVAHRTERARIQLIVNALVPLDYSDKVATDGAITTHLTTANDESAKFDHAKANDALKKADVLVSSAKIAGDAKAGTVPSENDIKALMEQPDGQKALDKMIEGMTAGDAKKDVMMMILKARFNMDVRVFATEADLDAPVPVPKSGVALRTPAPNLQKYYEMMTKVPDSHTKLNPSLVRFEQIEQNDSSYFSDAMGQVAMLCFGSIDSPGNALNDPGELVGVDVDCQPVPDGEVPMPTYGKWTTLHEIGHAVDDRKNYMTMNGGRDSFGGWKEHGADVSDIVDAALDKFKYDRSYIERTLAGGAPADAEIPQNVVAAFTPNEATEWNRRRDEFKDWADAVKHTTNIWSNAGQCAARALGTGANKRVYHQAYGATSWVSYKLSARSQGISGYQFRSPAEWFSELYAAHHSGKLKPTHPATDWLKAL